MQYLVASLLVLIVGPIAYRVVRTNDRWLSLLDGFNFTAIAGLVLFSILPEALGHGGAWAIAFCAAGMFVPTFVERNFHRAGRESHFAALGLAMLGLAAHAIVDGAALSHAATEGIQSVVQDQLDHAKHSHLPFGIILHRLPVGLTIWLLLRPKYGILAASSVLGLVAASTLCGYFAGPILLGDLSDTARAYFDALVAGSLMHVVVHRPHVESGSCSGHASSPSWMEGAGGAMGIGLLAALAIGGELLSSELGHEIERAFVDLALASAPALLLGFLVAGLLHSFWPKESVAWMRRGSGFTQSVKGVAVGLPMPVCSCGVVPIYRTLIERGAPTTAALAFMIATPEIGIDAVLLSIPLLGVEMTILRVVAAAIVALAVGWFVGARIRARDIDDAKPDDETPQSSIVRVREAIHFGFVELVDHTAPWILLGLAVAAVADPLLTTEWLKEIPPSLRVAAFALIGIPTYVCASGATPLVAVLLAKGISPGAALAFLLTGPATNVTTFGVLSKLHGRKSAAFFAVTILLLAVGMGVAVNEFLPSFAPAIGEGGDAHGHEEHAGGLALTSAIVVGLVFALSFLRRGPRHFAAQVLSRTTSPDDPSEGHSHSHSHHH